ncbi:hypothetical protein COV18_04645 [Candidatus Woesearchaeota archaeon CG10_big_fil_rev_8_21_14_0_10_37_12]|nr:MAG: hypothetical protein COV18_04645 [Candidatus Woesearchaeota archaeon CG10_big_fil_rev_8_21_14_0_10_37_12]
MAKRGRKSADDPDQLLLPFRPLVVKFDNGEVDHVPRINHRDIRSREQGLAQIDRWHGSKPMLYRTTNLDHSLRVAEITDELGNLVPDSTQYDRQLARAAAKVHDDIEIKIGDIDAGAKTRGTKADHQRIKDLETRAVEELIVMFDGLYVNGVRYERALRVSQNLRTAEGQVAKLADRLDGLCEAAHEYLAGNTGPVKRVTDGDGKLMHQDRFLDMANNYLLVRLPAEFAKYELWQVMIDAHPDHPFLNLPKRLRQRRKFALHTRESIEQPTSLAFYNLWRTLAKRAVGVQALVETRQGEYQPELEVRGYEKPESKNPPSKGYNEIRKKSNK